MCILQILAFAMAVLGCIGGAVMADNRRKILAVAPVALWAIGALGVPLLIEALEIEGVLVTTLAIGGVIGLQIAGAAMGVWLFQSARLDRMKRISLQDDGPAGPF